MSYHRPLVDPNEGLSLGEIRTKELREERIYAEFKKAVIKAIEEMGMEEFKKTSFFGSNKV